MDLRDYREWNRLNGLLSVGMEPGDATRFVLLNGSTGNFCLDYSDENFTKELAVQRAWSSDTGFYIKVNPDGNVTAINWWDKEPIDILASDINKNPKLFYQAITKVNAPLSGSIISFAKGAFLKLRGHILQADNGQASLRTFMYLLAALNDGVKKPSEVNREDWKLEEFNDEWIPSNDWDTLYKAFEKGNNIRPLVKLVLRHASNRLFQEAHREATQKNFQTAMFDGVYREYDTNISAGAFYTPTPLVRTIVQEALWALDKIIPLSQRTTLKILDPACGSAEFLREALRQLKIRNYTGGIEIIGWDKSEIACEISNFVLNYENISEWTNRVTVTITNKDSLKESWGSEKFDIVLMNPPFISFENINEYKELIIEKLRGLTKRQPDAAALFWKNAAEVVADNGVLGLVLPFSFLSAETYSGLREYIKGDLKMEFSLIGKLGSSGLFEKAMVIPCIQVATKGRSPSNTTLWTNYEQKAAYDAFRDLRIYRLSDIPTPINKPSYSIYENELLTQVTHENNWIVKSYPIYQLANRLKDFNTVEKIFTIKAGVATGINSVLLVQKEELFDDFPKSERNYFRPCIMRDSIKEGQLNDNWYLFYPYGKYKIETETELSNKLRKYYNKKLKPNQEALQKRKMSSEKWWELRRPTIDYQLKMSPKIISSYFGKSGYFAFDNEGKYMVVQSFAWLLKKEQLNNDQYYLAYLGLLHAPFVDKLLEMVCNVLDGGYYDLSKRYVEKMPLPNLNEADGETFSYLLNTGKKIAGGQNIDKVALDQVVGNIYGIDLSILKTG